VKCEIRKDDDGDGRRRYMEELMAEGLELEALLLRMDEMPIEERIVLKARALHHHMRKAVNVGDLGQREMVLDTLHAVFALYFCSIDQPVDPTNLGRN
jgi:hypothetical protein